MSTFTTERIQEISELTFKASVQNDLATLRKLQRLVEAPDPEGLSYSMGNEWFYGLLTPEQFAALNS